MIFKGAPVFIKKLLLYSVAMFAAMTFSYFFGVMPYTKAQDNESAAADLNANKTDANQSDNPDNIKTQSKDDQVNNGQINDQKNDQMSNEQINRDQDDSDQANGSQDGDVQSDRDQMDIDRAESQGKGSGKNKKLSGKKNDDQGQDDPEDVYKNTKSYIGDMSTSEKDPFRKPIYILNNEENADRLKEEAVIKERTIDDQMEAIRRWPLSNYKLVGIIWDVQNPKAMIVDPNNTKHMLKKNFRIGDRDGVISTIAEGSIVVLEDNIPVVLKIEQQQARKSSSSDAGQEE